jgi:hypothetical protein
LGKSIVKDTSRPIKEFTVTIDGKEVPILDAPLVAKAMGKNANDPEICPYLVRVEWTKAVQREQAYWEKGLFASQHTACRMRNQFTIERLTQHFGLTD